MKNSDFDENNFDEFENNETYDIVNIIDENNENIECFVIDAISYENNNYILVVPCEAFDEEEVEAFVLKEIKEQNEDAIYVPIIDENEYNKILVLFQENETDYEMKF